MSEKIDWSKIRIRCSSLGSIMTEAKDKATKDAGGFGKTTITELVKVYNQLKYGRKKEIYTKQLEKGTFVEEEGITLYSSVEKRVFKKNEERVENEFFTGHPDIYEGTSILKAKEVDDIKCSWELDTFMVKEVEDIDKIYWWQLQGYMDLTGAKKARLVYCLVSAPPHMVKKELDSLLWRMNVVSSDSPEYKIAAAELEHNMIVDDIPEQERVITIEVARSEEDIEKAKQKVVKCREWLADFDAKRMSRYKK